MNERFNGSCPDEFLAVSVESTTEERHSVKICKKLCSRDFQPNSQPDMNINRNPQVVTMKDDEREENRDLQKR